MGKLTGPQRLWELIMPDLPTGAFGALMLCLSAFALLGLRVSDAQGQAICVTYRGSCPASPWASGPSCSCYGDPGRVAYQGIPAGVPQIPSQPANIGALCRTNFGVCAIQPSPLGSGCYCRFDPGVVVP